MSVYAVPSLLTDPGLYKEYLIACQYVGGDVLVRREGVSSCGLGRVTFGYARTQLSSDVSDASTVCSCVQGYVDGEWRRSGGDGTEGVSAGVGLSGRKVQGRDGLESRGVSVAGSAGTNNNGIAGALQCVGSTLGAEGSLVAESRVDGGESHGESGDEPVEISRCAICGGRVGPEGCCGGPLGSAVDARGGATVGGCDDPVARKVGKWRKKNLKKKENRAGKIREGNWRREVPVVVAEKSEAQRTLETKWVVENKLKAFEAERKLELLKLQDVSEVAKLQERKLKAAGERAMVQIEKSHATLAATGNVPGVVPKGGYCTTLVDDPVLSDGSTPTCTISPDSSASMHEYKQCLLDLADTRKKLADAEKLIRRREIMDKATYAQSVAEFSAGSESVLSDGLRCELDRKFGEKGYEYDGRYKEKHVVRRVFNIDGMRDDDCDGLEDVY